MTPRLYTFGISHFSEKARWVLDASGIGYDEIRLTPFLHLLQTPWLTRGQGRSVPILLLGQRCLSGSSEIVLWAGRHRVDEASALFPCNAEERAQLDDIQRELDRLGFHVLRYTYDDALRQPDALLAVWTADSGRAARLALRVAMPVLRSVFRRIYRIDRAGVERSRQAIADQLERMAATTSATGYLIGGRLTVADLAAAAILAPLVAPDEHPTYASLAFRRCAEHACEMFEAHPMMDWVRRIYAEHRCPLTEQMASAA